MKFKDVITHATDGSERPKVEQEMIRAALIWHKCDGCGETVLCAYEIMLNAFFCSDECRREYVSR